MHTAEKQIGMMHQRTLNKTRSNRFVLQTEIYVSAYLSVRMVIVNLICKE